MAEALASNRSTMSKFASQEDDLDQRLLWFWSQSLSAMWKDWNQQIRIQPEDLS